MTFLIALVFAFPVSAFAASARLTWDANQEDDLAGYKLLLGTQSGSYSSTIDVGLNNSYELTNLASATRYFFVVKAYDTSNNLSDASQELSYQTVATDTTKPTIEVVSSARYQKDKAIQVAYAVSDSSGIAEVRLWVRINNSGWVYSGKSAASATGIFNYTAIGDANYYFAVVAKDAFGNVNSVPVGVGSTITTVDSLAPSAGSLSAPALVRNEAISLRYSSATDGNGSGISSMVLWVKEPNASWKLAGLVSNSANGIFNYQAREAGRYYFAVVANDKAGNVSIEPSGIGMASTLFEVEEQEIVVPPTSDACPADPKKTTPGVCGCGVVEDVRDFDGDGVKNCLDADRDGDGVADAQEKLDGTNPEDAGSVKAVVGTKVCTEWNGFLGRLWNILELVNMSSEDLAVSVSLYDIQGNAIQGGKLVVAAGAQRDLLIHDLSGRKENQYGLFCLQHEGEVGDLDGRMVYYKGISNNTRKQDFDFAFAMPFSNGLMGNQYVTFNTYHPSFRATDQRNLVANWIQLTNLGQQREKGKLYFYGMDGKLLGQQEVLIAASQRTDFSGHQFGANQVGHVAWVPNNPTARFQLRNIRYLYDNAVGANSFDTAFQLEGMHPSGESLVVPLQLEGSSAILEVVNVTDQEMPVEVSLYNELGDIQQQKALRLAARSSAHIIANEFLPGVSNAVAVVKGSKRNGLIAVGMQYSRLEDGAIKYMYGLQAKQATGLVLKNSYNTYLQQTSKLVLTNAKDKAENISFSLVRSDGVRIVNGYQVTLPAKGMKEINLNELTATDEYGVVEITTNTPGTLIAWVNRIRSQEYVVPTPSR